MKRLIIFLFFFANIVFANICVNNKPYVIYIPLDGISIKKFNPQSFPYLFSKVIPAGELVGSSYDSRLMTNESIPASLPSYFCTNFWFSN